MLIGARFLVSTASWRKYLALKLQCYAFLLLLAAEEAASNWFTRVFANYSFFGGLWITAMTFACHKTKRMNSKTVTCLNCRKTNTYWHIVSPNTKFEWDVWDPFWLSSFAQDKKSTYLFLRQTCLTWRRALCHEASCDTHRLQLLNRPGTNDSTRLSERL